MKRKIMAVSALLAALLAGGYTVQAGPMGMGCRGQHAEAGQHGCRSQMNCREEGGCLGHLEQMAGTLGLSDSQRQEIEAVIKAQQEGNASLMAKIAEGRRQFMEATRGSDMDEAKVAELAEEQGKLMSEMMISHVRVKSQVFALLTPEQQKKADEFCEGCSGGPGCAGGPGCGPRCGSGEQKPGTGGAAGPGSKM